MQVGVGVSIAKDYIEAAKEALFRAKKYITKDKIDFAIVFSTVEFAHPLFLKTISRLLGPTTIVGSSSLAVMSNQGFLKHGLVVMLISLSEKIYFNAALVEKISTKSINKAGEELAEKLLSGAKDIHRKLSVIFCDGLIKNTADLILGLQDKFGKSFPLVGASTADNPVFQKNYLYLNQEIYNDAACGILLGGNLNFGLGVRHGWKPLGKPRFVTESFRNTVYKIDSEPAVKIYEEYFARKIPELTKDLKRIAAFYPIGIYLSGKKEYLLRNLISIRNDGSLVFHGDVPVNSQIRFMIGAKDSILDATRQAASEAKQGMLEKKIDFVLVFDSVFRFMLLGRQVNKELEIIQEEFGRDTPIIGLCTCKEYAPLKIMEYSESAYSHNQAITILAVGK